MYTAVGGGERTTRTVTYRKGFPVSVRRRGKLSIVPRTRCTSGQPERTVVSRARAPKSSFRLSPPVNRKSRRPRMGVQELRRVALIREGTRTKRDYALQTLTRFFVTGSQTIPPPFHSLSAAKVTGAAGKLSPGRFSYIFAIVRIGGVLRS